MPPDLREQLQVSLGEAYRIERELGGGGMSRVFLALETALGRRVVVKVLLPELAAGVSVDRFRREIQLAAQLQHPHIVPLLTAGESGGLTYFTMPFVTGESLRARLAHGELPVPEAVRILRDVAAALAYAHAQGVVHRDIKPDNVLLSHGVAVVTDFGVAKALTASVGLESPLQGPSLTSMGVSLGTPAYMAPEQATADPGMDHRVDIYSFGVTAYEMLTGEPLFMRRTAHEMLGAHLALAPEPIGSRRPGIPPLLALVVMKCLAKRPADRPQTAAELIGALDSVTTPTGGTVSIAAHPPPPRSRGARRLIPVVAALGLAAAIAVWAWPHAADAPPAPAAVPPPVRTPAQAPAADTAPAPPAEPLAEPPAPPPPERRVEPRAEPRKRPAAEERAVLTRLRAEANDARLEAVAAGADAGGIARGDSSMALAESLAGRGRIAEAAAQLTRAATLWSGAERPPPEAAAPAESAPPPPEPVRAPAPAPRRPRPTTPASNPEADIRALFADYGAAIEARSVEAIRRSYPGLQPEQARVWEDFFRGVTDVQVELNVTELEIAGDAAEARLAGVYVFTNPSTHRTQREIVAFRAALRREDGRWRIASLR